MVLYILFKILPTLFALTSTIYIASAIYSPVRLKAKLAKHKQGTLAYEMHCYNTLIGRYYEE